MSADQSSLATAVERRVWRKRLIGLATPGLALCYQISAKEIADALPHRALTHVDLAGAVFSPWFVLLLASGALGLVVWMFVLTEVKLSEAFPITALTYVLIIAVTWIVFHEPADTLTVLGSAAILSGVWLIGREEPAA